MFSKRIVVTGLGAITPIGNSVDDFWRALLDGHSGVAPVRAFPAEGCRPSYASEIKDFVPEQFGLARRKLKMMGRHAQLAFCAANQAWVDASLTADSACLDRARIGVVLGIGMLNADVTDLGRAFSAVRERQTARSGEVDPGNETFDHAAFGRHGAGEMLPLWLLRHIPNLAAAHIAIALDARGPSNTITTGCVSGANALGEAARLIARGAADIVLAGGADARVSPLAMLRYRQLGWLATRDDVEPQAVSAPFDRDASGFVNGEGAGLLVLESLDHARSRGARIYAELSGYGAANDAYEFLEPQPEGLGLRRALSICLERSGVSPSLVDAVFSPATAVPAFDRSVAAALTATFDSTRTRPATTATRSIVGHTHAASAALDCVAAVRSICDSKVPATLNLHRPIADLALVTEKPLAADVSTAVVAAYGFGGHAAALGWQRSAA